MIIIVKVDEKKKEMYPQVIVFGAVFMESSMDIFLSLKIRKRGKSGISLLVVITVICSVLYFY